MNNGWICLPRSLTEWEWYKNPVVKSLFFHCMLRANYKDARFEGMEIKRGEFVTSYQHLAEETGLSVMQVRTALKKLQSSGEITVNSTNRFTRVTLCNYSLYQDVYMLEQQSDNVPPTNDYHTGNKRITPINNNNKYNNKNNFNNYRRKKNKNSYQRLKSGPSFDIEEIKKRSALNDNYMEQLFGDEPESDKD